MFSWRWEGCLPLKSKSLNIRQHAVYLFLWRNSLKWKRKWFLKCRLFIFLKTLRAVKIYETYVLLSCMTDDWDIVIWFSQDSTVIIEESWEFSKKRFGVSRWRACSWLYVVFLVNPKWWSRSFSISKGFFVVLWKLLENVVEILKF